MEPVLPAFAGFVPPELQDRVPQARIVRSPNWGNFPPEFCCMPLLDPLDPLFRQLGAAFVRVRRTACTACTSCTGPLCKSSAWLDVAAILHSQYKMFPG